MWYIYKDGYIVKYTKDLKNVILGECNKGLNKCEICKRFNIPKSTIYHWLKNTKNIENTNITYLDYYKLNNKYKNKCIELEILEKLHCFKDSTTKEKEIAISKFVGVYPIKTMCRVLDLPKGTFYNFHLRRKQVTYNQIRDEQLKKEIYRVFKVSDERFGAKKIWIKLSVEGINTTLNKVQKLMKLLNLHSRQNLRKIESIKQKDNSQYYINKLKRVFNQTEPNKYWVSDVTELQVKRNKFYLCVIFDLFSRKVVAYRLSIKNNTQLTVNTFKDAFENRNRPKDLTFHSDQGSNYTAYEFRDLLHSLKVNQSFSKSGNPYDNACMESFFSNLKREEYNGKQYEYFDELEESVDSYMRYYNDYRPHQTLKNKTPNQFENDYYAGISNKKATIVS